MTWLETMLEALQYAVSGLVVGYVVVEAARHVLKGRDR